MLKWSLTGANLRGKDICESESAMCVKAVGHLKINSYVIWLDVPHVYIWYVNMKSKAISFL